MGNEESGADMEREAAHDGGGRASSTGRLGRSVLLAASALAVVVGGTVVVVRLRDRSSTLNPTGTFKRCSPAPPTSTSADLAPPSTAHGMPKVSSRLVLPTDHVPDGCTLKGTVVVVNDSGHELHAGGCMQIFAVGLDNHRLHQQLLSAACEAIFTIPRGRSTYPVTISTTYQTCVNSGPESPGTPRCRNGRAPAIPEGTYRTKVYGADGIVPRPPAVTVEVD